MLDGELAARARDAVAAVVAELRRPSPEQLRCRLRKRGFPTLGALEPWAALLFAYRAEATGSAADDERADEVLEEAHDVLAPGNRLDLYGGWCGVGWALSHLSETDPEDDELAGLDAAVLALLERPGLVYCYDLIGGLVGLGVYLLERLPGDAASRGLRRLVEIFDDWAEKESGTVTWFTPPHLMSVKDRSPHGAYNLGVAHGIPGIVGLLARIYRAGIERRRVRSLLDGALPWLLARRLPVAAGEPCYPRWLVPGEPPEPCRVAWCYGDLGAAWVLFDAAAAVGRSDWREEALELARHAARVPAEAARVLDPGICHGAAGNAHVFNRFYQATGDELLRDAASGALRRTLDYRRPGRGVGGFESFYPAGEEPGWRSDASFLMGAPGIGLVLLAAISPQEPDWDRLLLLS
ncbi:MAG: hypothetical protein D6696_20840 [Acidobacteria bacterium]|nr:MAG: hypothetical protein D6696_20840 [Acidobacteriota bacterium]